jgi:hypothetical protein
MEMTAIGGPSLFYPPLSPSRPATAKAAQAATEKRCVIEWILPQLSGMRKFFFVLFFREKPEKAGKPVVKSSVLG